MEIEIKLVLSIIIAVIVNSSIYHSCLSLDQEFINEQVLDNTAPNDPYASYLLWPHFSFAGTFRADVSTVNNIVSNHNPNTTRKDPSWHPKGSGEWSVNASVTQMCFANGTCSAPDRGKEIPVTDTGTRTFAKIVDLDPQEQLVSEIWGWKIRVGNNFFGYFNPVPFKYLWQKMPNKTRIPSFGAVYQSELLDVEWNESSSSPDFFKQLKEAMGNDNITSHRLSIRFNVDMYVTDSEQSNFTTGRISGTIGLLGKKSPPFFILGRSMKPQKVKYLQETFFYVNQQNKKVFIDFGNSLPINDDGSVSISHYDNLYVALSKGEHPKLDCSDELMWIGSVDHKLPQWYLNTSGIQTFPVFGSFTTQEMTKLQNSPLLVVETTGNPHNLVCKKVLLAEASDGIDIHPYNLWVQRKNPGDNVSIEVFATKFGKPLPGAKVKLEPCNSFLDKDGPPLVGQPALDVNPDINVTNDDGIANFTFVANDPQNNRTYIDGQLYPFLYSINGTKTCDDIDLNSLALIRIFDSYFPNLKSLEPTWLEHVYPIFKKYADLFPVMTDNFVDLANYYDVFRHKKAIKETISRPESDPNYMPVTRDLSRDKKNLILKWLSKEKPDIGDPRRFYTVENLRKDLQTALQLEHSTIPPYLTALASIKNSYNLEIQEVIHSIVIQEMMHMALVANILNAVGGEPSVYNEDFIPNYPSRLPGGVQPSLVIPIEKLSLGLVQNIFMKIEQPEVDVSRLSNFEHIFSLLKRIDGAPASNGQCESTEEGRNCEVIANSKMAQTGPDDPMVDDDVSDCFNSSNKEQFLEDFRWTQLINMVQSRDPGDLTGLPLANQEKPAQGGIFPGENVKAIKSENTIGRFYHHILNALGYLTNCGKNNSIFTGNQSKQVNFDGWSVQGKTIKVTNYQSSIAAIQAIVEQGEGSSPCNPDSWFSGKKQLSHYYLFYSIAEKREIKVFHTKSTGSSEIFNCSYQFFGPMIPFDPNGVWPMVDSPEMSRYQPGSKAHKQAERFNKAYTRLLKSLDKVFNGHPDTLRDAIGCMYSVDLHLKDLVKTPIEDNGDPLVGPNAGPTFDFTP